MSIAATRRADVFRALMDVQSLYRIHSIRNHTEKALSYSRDLVDTLYDRARLVHYLDALLRVPQNSPPKSTPIAPPRLRRRWVVLATTAALDHAFYLPIVARVRKATLAQCSAHCALRRAGWRESFRQRVRRLGSSSDSIRSSRSCPHTAGTRLSLPRPSSECAAAPSAVLVQRPPSPPQACYCVLWRLQAVISRVLNDNPRAHRLLPRSFISNVVDFHDLAFHRMAAMFVAACAAVVDDDDYVIVTDSMKLPISRNAAAAAAAAMASACLQQQRMQRNP